MVVPHEGFHNQPEAQRAPPALAEAAAMLAGFATAAGFARERFGSTPQNRPFPDAVGRDVDRGEEPCVPRSPWGTSWT